MNEAMYKTLEYEDKNDKFCKHTRKGILQSDIVVQVWNTKQWHNPMPGYKEKETQNSLCDEFWQDQFVYSICGVVGINIIKLQIRQAHELYNMWKSVI